MTAILLPRRSISRSRHALKKAGERAIMSAVSRMAVGGAATSRFAASDATRSDPRRREVAARVRQRSFVKTPGK